MTWMRPFNPGVIVLDNSYSETNADTATEVGNGVQDNVGQVFTANGGKITQAKFSLQRGGPGSQPTGNGTARLYATTGTQGVDAVGTGTALAISDTLDVSTVPYGYALYTFNFTGAQQYQMVAGTTYAIVFEYTGGTSTSYLFIEIDLSAPTHTGNLTGRDTVGAWFYNATIDTIFYVFARK